jgi:hypothetical protein
MKHYVQLSSILVLLGSPLPLWAGNIDSSAAPGSTSGYSISDVCNHLETGTDGSQTTFVEPIAAPGSTGCTLNEVMTKAPLKDNTDGATPAEVANTKTYWGLRTDGSWGLQTGTGTIATYAAAVPKSGQTLCYDAGGTVIACAGTGQDGEYQKGVAWPGPRFTDNFNGTVTDNLTGLIWLKNAYCAAATRTWATALTDVDQLNTDGTMNTNDCGDTSNGGSHQTDWRLPNRKELFSLVDDSQVAPALPVGYPFSGVQTTNYWSSTSAVGIPNWAWYMRVNNGRVTSVSKASNYNVWAVRGGV